MASWNLPEGMPVCRSVLHAFAAGKLEGVESANSIENSNSFSGECRKRP
jgi:hypothetical protein